ncbi:hypothetical protein D3C85_843900 [compost metagenome]
MRFKIHRRLQQQRLVPVLTRRHIGLEEPMLNRRQCRLTREQALLGHDLFGTRGHCRQRLHRLMLEQVPWAEVNTLLTCPTDDLDRQDRIAAQFEEVIVEADLLEFQHVAPDTGQRLLQRVARGDVRLAIEIQVRCGQRTAVKLAVGRQRPVSQQHQVRRYHVVRQLGFQVRLERVAQRCLLRGVLFGHVTDQVASQLFAARGIERQYHGFTHRRMFQQAGFNFTELDAKAANLHLMVDAPQVLHQAIDVLAHQVAGAVQPPAMSGKRVGDKAFGSHPRTLVIALGQTGPANV